jgi:hypothetical protein
MSTKAERTERNVVLLRAAGYAPTVKVPGEIHFKKEGGTYVLMLDDEEAYWSLLYPRFWAISTDTQRAKAESAAIAATEALMVGKVYVTADANVSASFEVFLPPQAVPPIARAITTLSVAVDLFKDKVGA